MEKILHVVFPVEKYRCRQCYAAQWSLRSPVSAPFQYLLSMAFISILGLTTALLT